MSGEPILILIGNLTADPTIRFTANGTAVANFTVAATPSYFDRTTNQWKDGEALFMNCSAWKTLAQNIAESLTKGSRVIMQGRLKPNSYEDRNGNKRYSINLEVEDIGPSLRFAIAQAHRVGKTDRSDDWGSSFEAPGSQQEDVTPF